jgi:DNA-binding transcriptional MerR regulator
VGREYTIGRLAEAAGVHVETIRYYERRGLLAPPARSAAGYRLYSDDDLALLQLIARGKGLGFTLTEIGELVESSGARSVAEVLAAAQAKAEALADRQRELAETQRRLRELTRLCADGVEADCVALRVSPAS